MQTEASEMEEEVYRREAMGAFAHEVRTPLTSIRMVIELARRQSQGGQLVLDTELADMLGSSIDDLQELADDLQEASWLERGRVVMSAGPCDLGTAIEAARALLTAQHVRLTAAPMGDTSGPWDAARLVRAIAGFAESANRMGDGSGEVRLECFRRDDGVELSFTSGTPQGAAKAISADAGFSFFRSRQVVMAMGGSVHCDGADRYATIVVALPPGSRRVGEDG